MRLGTLLLVQASPADSLPPMKPVVIRHITVVEVATGALRPDMSVVIRAGRIAGIGTDAQTPIPPAEEVFDGRGKYVIPGLWDMHVRLSWTTGRGAGEAVRWLRVRPTEGMAAS